VDSEFFEAQYNLGIVLYEQGRLDSAEAAFRRAVSMAPHRPQTHTRLGDTLFDQQHPEQALGSYRRALEIDPDDAANHFNVGKTLEVMGNSNEAIAAYRRSLELNPQSAVAQQSLAGLLHQQGKSDEAVAVYQRWLAANPDDPIARHMVSAITGRDVAQRASDDYVQRTFDAFAGDFEAQLSKLRYQAPKLIATTLSREILEAAPQFDVLDAGCGTGLCGPLLRGYARRLTGVDLSGGMLQKARQRKVYDDLIQAELTAHLRDQPEGYDIIVSSDTFNYFGSLGVLFASACKALRPGGLMVFTLERNEQTEADWHLKPHGRYTHSEAYLRRCLEEAGLRIVSVERDTLRHEQRRPVAGWIATARRPPAAQKAAGRS